MGWMLWVAMRFAHCHVNLCKSVGAGLWDNICHPTDKFDSKPALSPAHPTGKSHTWECIVGCDRNDVDALASY